MLYQSPLRHHHGRTYRASNGSALYLTSDCERDRSEGGGRGVEKHREVECTDRRAVTAERRRREVVERIIGHSSRADKNSVECLKKRDLSVSMSHPAGLITAVGGYFPVVYDRKAALALRTDFLGRLFAVIEAKN